MKSPWSQLREKSRPESLFRVVCPKRLSLEFKEHDNCPFFTGNYVDRSVCVDCWTAGDD